MESGRRLTRGLAIAGSVMMWMAFVTVLVAAVGFVPHDVTWLAFLAVGAMDLSPLVLIGGFVAMLAAVRVRSHRVPIGCGLAAVFASLAVGLIWSPTIPATGWPPTFAMALIIFYWFGAVAAGLASVSLVRALATRSSQDQPSAARG